MKCRELPPLRLSATSFVVIGAIFLSGCAGTPSTVSTAASSDRSGNMLAGVRSSITVTNASYERAIECSGATGRLIAHGGSSTSDLREIQALGQAWLDNASDIGRTKGFKKQQIEADAAAAGSRMDVAQAGAVWARCRGGK